MKEKQARRMSTFRLFVMGLAAGGVGGYLLGRRLALRRSMPYLDLWQRELEPRWGEVKAAVLAARMESRYQTLLAARPRLTNRALRFHLEMGILPGIALYQILAEETDDTADARRLLASMLAKAVEPLRDVVASLGKFEEPFGAFRNMVRWTMRLAFPSVGWKISVVKDDPTCLELEVGKCFYREVLEHYGEGALTEVYCDVDDAVFDALPPTITWTRRETLARGGSCCSFRWCRAEPSAEDADQASGSRTGSRTPETAGETGGTSG